MMINEIIATVLDTFLAILMVCGIFFSDSGGDRAIKPIQFVILILMICNIWLIWKS